MKKELVSTATAPLGGGGALCMTVHSALSFGLSAKSCTCVPPSGGSANYRYPRPPGELFANHQTSQISFF